MWSCTSRGWVFRFEASSDSKNIRPTVVYLTAGQACLLRWPLGSLYIMASSSSNTDRRYSSDPDTAHRSSTREELRPALRRNPSNTMSTSTSSSNYTHSSAASHPYLGDRQVDAIESWKTTVPGKMTCPPRLPEEDPVVQAYLQTKMALFESLATAGNKAKGPATRDSNGHHHHVDNASDRTSARQRTKVGRYAK